MKSVNKILYIVLGSWLFGTFGVNRFMRGQIGLGILKILTFGGFGIWSLVDLVISLVKLGAGYGENYEFDNRGRWTK